MNLKTLLQAFDFDELFPTIVTMYPNAKRHKAEFEQAFDISTQMQPVFTANTIRYQLMQNPYGSGKFFGAPDACFKGNWELILGKNITRSKEVDLSDEEIASNCLICMIFISTPPAEFKASRDRLVRG